MALPVVNGTSNDDPNLLATRASVIYGYAGDDRITGSFGDDYIGGGTATVRHLPGDGNMVTVGDDDIINAGKGDDWIYMGAGSDRVDGGAGIDNADFSGARSNFKVKIENAYSANSANMTNLVVDLAGSYEGDFKGTGFNVHVKGSLHGIERVTGTIYDDRLTGTSRDESFRPLAGKDTIDAGGGFDILRYDHANFGITDKYGIIIDFELHKVNDTNDDIDTFSGIEHVIGSGKSDRFLGDNAAQTFTGGAGYDVFDGGGGVDIVDYGWEEGKKAILVNLLALGTGEVPSANDTYGNVDEFKNIELIKGTSFNDKMYGDRSANQFWGRLGNDLIRGNLGNDVIRGDSDPALKTGGSDTLYGDFGNDKIDGCAGNDRIDGGAGNDELNGGYGIDTFVGGEGRGNPWVINLVTGTAKYAYLKETDKISNFENVEGSNGDDQITGDKNVNDIDGGKGDDTIIGGLGLDKLYGGEGSDTVDYGASTLAVKLDLETSRATFTGVTGSEVVYDFENIFGGKEDDTLNGTAEVNILVGDAGDDKISGRSGNDEIDGGAGNDTLKGDGGADYLGGGAGGDKLDGGISNDILYGAAGKDTQTGGAGGDIFTFTSVKDSLVGTSRDTIADFKHAQDDKISVKGIDANTKVKDDQEFKFVDTAAFSKKAGELRFDKGILSGDVDGDGKADFEIALTKVASLEKDDFLP